MMFMNEFDMEYARVNAARIHGPGSKFAQAADVIVNLCEWANENSDGWAYWPKPVRASKSLQEALMGNRINGEDLTAGEFRRLLQPIRAFLTRHYGYAEPGKWEDILGEDLP